MSKKTKIKEDILDLYRGGVRIKNIIAAIKAEYNTTISCNMIYMIIPEDELRKTKITIQEKNLIKMLYIQGFGARRIQNRLTKKRAISAIQRIIMMIGDE